MPGKIFISYRRDDGAQSAARVRDRLARVFGNANVFMDVDNLIAGQRFDRELEKALNQCDTFLAVIGPRWLEILNSRTAGQERDYVREELASALKRNVVVIPVLVDRATLPRADVLPEGMRELVLHHKHDISYEYFGRDVEALIDAIKLVRKAGRTSVAAPLSRVPWGWATGAAAAVLMAAYTWAYFSGAPVWWPSFPLTQDETKAAREAAAAKKAADEAAQQAEAKRVADEAAQREREQRAAEAKRVTDENARRDEETRRLAEAKRLSELAAENERLRKEADERRRIEEARRQEEARRVEEARRQEEEKKRLEEARLRAEAQKQAELARGPQLSAADRERVAQFYRGKTANIIVGFAPGGGLDTYARYLANSIEKYIPGTPTVIVQNRPGGGSLVAANFLYNDAPRDGTSIGTVSPAIFVDQSNASTAKFQSLKFSWLGSMNQDLLLCYSNSSGPYRSFQDVLTREFIVGSTGPGSIVQSTPLILNATLGSKFKIVLGYRTTNEARLATDRAEVHGVCGQSFLLLRSGERNWAEKYRVLLAIGRTRLPELANVPLASELAKGQDGQMLLYLTLQAALAAPFLAPPGIPADRLSALRQAFADTLRDGDLLERTKNAFGLNILPLRFDEAQQILSEWEAVPAAVKRKIADIVK